MRTQTTRRYKTAKSMKIKITSVSSFSTINNMRRKSITFLCFAINLNLKPTTTYTVTQLQLPTSIISFRLITGQSRSRSLPCFRRPTA
ncbi:hypothetical protein Hanom_Chr13g01189511 [Helianthus anomalus]